MLLLSASISSQVTDSHTGMFGLVEALGSGTGPHASREHYTHSTVSAALKELITKEGLVLTKFHREMVQIVLVM